MLAIPIFVLLFFGTAEAHKVMVFAWIEGNTIHTESKFSGGKLVKEGKVEVFDAVGSLLLTGTTDDQGEFSFPLNNLGPLSIVLTAGMGHQGSWTISREEISDAGFSAPSPAAAAANHQERPQLQTADVRKSLPNPAGEPISCSQEEVIRQAVEKALDKKLQPILKQLAAAQEKGPTFTDIVGGIGYIVGLVGLVAYLQARKKS
ncbi:MAG: hypothetical protein JXO49_02815 [Deltaproteobacteria bacterium]|nr:hypothetical protein [Candidatus Anaeroferrophillus wilburensis]MBN2888261.1 hypothetical protein [Deltaproteobacteria bacterium]